MMLDPLYKFFSSAKTNRKGFLKILGGAILLFLNRHTFAGIAFAKDPQAAPRKRRPSQPQHDLVVAEGNDPYQNTLRAVEALGGMGVFVRKNDVVVVKPNMGWDRTPEQAANTNPAVVAALVELCYKAGAKRVNVFDVPCNDERRVHLTSGIRAAAESKGAFVSYTNEWDIVKADFPYPSAMQNWPILREAIACDVFINAPVLKHHTYTGLTLSLKNLMGICGGNRGSMHVDIGHKLADLADFIKPDLTIIDATRVLIRNGPTGGNLADVITLNKVVASADGVLADACGCSLVDRDPMTISYLKVAAERRLGKADLSLADVVHLKA